MHSFIREVITFSCLGFLTTVMMESTTTTPQKLPDKHDDFRAMRTGNSLYIDKSQYISQLLNAEDKFFSMCRPGRFGKSAFLQMLNSFFRSEKELFRGLNICDEHDWRDSSPVIYLDFSVMDVDSLENFQVDLNRAIVLTGRSYGIEIDDNLPLYSPPSDELQSNHSKLGQLMDHMSENGKRGLVVLIDEYDWPIRQYTAGNEFSELKHIRRLELRSFLAPFFYQFERAKRFIKFLFVTCTTKISYSNPIDGQNKKSIALTDLTFDPRYGGMMGLSGEEVNTNLRPHVSAIISRPNETFSTLVRQLRKRYNGYCFAREHTTECRQYNFHSIMSSLREGRFDHFWHPANDSKYKELFEDYRDEMYSMKGNVFNASGLTVSRERLQKEYALADVPMVVGMIFCGYLTLRGYDERTHEFNVDFPNDEARESFRRGVYRYLLGREISSEQFLRECENLKQSMADGEVQKFVYGLNKLAFAPADKSTLFDSDLYSYERVAKIFETCDFCMQESVPNERNDRFAVVVEPQPNTWTERRVYKCGLKIGLSNSSEYRIHFEFGRSAPCAMNVLLKGIGGQETRPAVHLMGINFGESGDGIHDWIGITYANGKCTEVSASCPQYLRMYAYVTDLDAYSRLV